jgi:large subunit ribosomal protein L10
MNRTQKAEFIEEMHGRLTETPLVILTDFIGSTVAEMDTLRRSVEEDGVYFKVVKNTLAKRALEGTGKEALAQHFRGNIGVIIAGEDPVAAAKVLKKQIKDNDKLIIRAGFFEGDLLDPKAVAAVAELPSKEELQVMLLRTLLAAPRQVLGIVQAPARDLLYLLKNYETKLEAQGAE